MPVHRRITALLAALTTMAGGPFVAAAAADTDADAERGGRPTLLAGPTDHVAVQHRRAADLAGALGVTEERLGVVLHELRAERRAADVVGARPPVRTPAQLAAERDAYAAALAAKVGATPAVVAAALDGLPAVRPASPPGT